MPLHYVTQAARKPDVKALPEAGIPLMLPGCTAYYNSSMPCASHPSSPASPAILVAYTRVILVANTHTVMQDMSHINNQGEQSVLLRCSFPNTYNIISINTYRIPREKSSSQQWKHFLTSIRHLVRSL